MAAAERHGAFEVCRADLAEIALPFLDEPEHPSLRRYQHSHTRAWSEIVDAADAFVVVMPEYNHGIPAPVKNAIDFLYQEWRNKPLGFVSYGGASGGLRAGEMLKLIAVSLSMIPVAAGVQVPAFRSLIVDGTLQATDRMRQRMDAMLKELAQLGDALRELRLAGRQDTAATPSSTR